MKTIILYARRNVGLCTLSFLVAKGFTVKVISDDENILWMANEFGCEVLKDFHNMGDFQLFISVHGRQLVPMKYLNGKNAINIHPCIKYKGKDPIARYIANEDTEATIDAHRMTEQPDEGKIIHSEEFITPVCRDYATFYNIAIPYYYKCLNEVLKRVL